MAGRADIAAGKAHVTLYVKNAAFLRGLRDAKRTLSDFGASMMAVGRQAATAGAALLLPLGLATKKFADFDDAMRSVGAVSQASASDLAKLTKTAEELGRTTSFTAVEVAALMGELGRAGFKPDQVNAMTSAVLNLSRATGTDAAQSAGIMSATIRQFNLQAEDATRVADGLTAAANKSFTSVTSLGESLKFAAPVAADFNMSLEDTLAILGGLGNVGIQGSDAGTTLRRLLTITGAEAKNLQSIFGVAFKDAAGNARPLIDVLAEVNEATANLGTADRAQKFNEAFGLLGITGASAIGKSSVDIRQLAKDIKAAGGVAQETAEDMDAGLGGAFRRLMSAVEGAQLAIGKSLEGVLQGVTEGFNRAVTAATDWVDANREVVVAIAAAGAALVTAGASLIAVGLSFKLAAVGVGIFSAATKAALVVTSAFAAISAVVKASILATSAVFAVLSGTTTGYTAAWLLLSALQASYPAVAGAVTGAMAVIGAAMSANSVAAGIATLAHGVLSAAMTSAASVAAAAWAVIASPIMPFVAAGAAAVAIVGAIAGAAAIAAARGIDFAGAWDGVKSALATAMQIVKDVGGVIMKALSAGDYASAAQALWIGLKIAFWEGAGGAMDALKWLFSEGLSFVKRFFSQMLTITQTASKEVALALINPFRAKEKISEALSKLSMPTMELGFEANADAARAELAALKNQIADPEGKKTGSDPAADAAFKQQKDLIEQQIVAIREGEEASERLRLKQMGMNKEQIAEIMRLQRAKEKLAQVEGPSKESIATQKQVTDGIKEQIIALREGADAAERFRLKQMGLNDEQVRSVEAMRKQQEQLEAIRSKSEKRVDAIVEGGDRMLDKGASPREIMEREQGWIRDAFKAGQIDRQTAEKADAEAKDRMIERMKKLKDEARRLEEELRSPQEILNDRLRKISQLHSSGALSDKHAAKAEDEARREVKEMIERQNKSEAVESSRGGMPKTSIATHNMAAAIALGQGGGGNPQQRMVSIGERQLKAIEQQNKKLDKIDGRLRNNGLHHP